jgi:Protein of unknown function (DUF4058)
LVDDLYCTRAFAMASPFPGMDPYIEACDLWGDFHDNLIGEIQRALADRLPERYVVRAGERSYLAIMDVNEGAIKRPFLPDVSVAGHRKSSRGSRRPRVAAPAVAALGDTPVMMRAQMPAEHREPYLEIIQTDPKRRLVTGIEILSPTNKRPGTKGWRLYRRKRLAYLNGHANLVEIDLLRQGRRMPMASDWPASPYYLLVCKKRQAPRCAVWPAFMTRPLAHVPIPLLPLDADVLLDLKPMIDAIYARSRYDRDIDYRQPLVPPLGPAELDWLQRQIGQHQRTRAGR